MEAIVKKFQSKFRKVREAMSRWDKLQSCLISQFRNAFHIVDRLQVISLILLLYTYNFFILIYLSNSLEFKYWVCNCVKY